MTNHHGYELVIRNESQSNTSGNASISYIYVCNERYGHSNYSCHSIPDIIVLVVYVVLIIFNFIGNGLVLSIIAGRKSMRTFTNYMLMNLSIADLAIGLFCMTMEIPMEIDPHVWVYARSFCHFLYPIQTATVYASILTLVVLSCSRYYAIVHPLSTELTGRHGMVLILFIWVISLLFVAPYTFGLRLNEQTGHCEEIWTVNQRKIFTLLTFLFQYAIPIALISAAYFYIVYELNFRSRPGTPTHEDRVKKEENKKVIKLLVVVTATFAICVLPHHFIILWIEFGNATSFPYIEDIAIITFFVLYMNSVLNPILYNACSSTFRKEFRRQWSRLSRVYSTTTECDRLAHP